MHKINNGSSFKKPLHLNDLFQIKLKGNSKEKRNWIEKEIEKKWKLQKIKNCSLFKKPLYINDLFGNKIKKEIE